MLTENPQPASPCICCVRTHKTPTGLSNPTMPESPYPINTKPAAMVGGGLG